MGVINSMDYGTIEDTLRSLVKFVISITIILVLTIIVGAFIFNHRISKLESQLEKYKTESSISDDEEVDNSEESYRDEEDEG